jgi:hypothetical protein
MTLVYATMQKLCPHSTTEKIVGPTWICTKGPTLEGRCSNSHSPSHPRLSNTSRPYTFTSVVYTIQVGDVQHHIWCRPTHGKEYILQQQNDEGTISKSSWCQKDWLLSRPTLPKTNRTTVGYISLYLASTIPIAEINRIELVCVAPHS